MFKVEKVTEGGVGLELCADLFGVDPVGCNMVATSLAGALPVDKDTRLMGSVGDVATIAGRCSERAGGAAELDELYRIYRLTDLQRPSVPGRLVDAGSEEVELAAQRPIRGTLR